jgi:phage baseplate assembly protein W
MPASGFPLGVYPAGLGGPTTAPDAPTAPPVIARYIEPLTGDYELDATTGQYTGMPPVRQMVEIALGSVRGSSAVAPDIGTEIPPLIDEAFASAVDADVRFAVRKLVEARLIRVRDVRVETGSPAGRAAIVFEYTDLTLPQGSPARNDEVEVPIT